MKGRGRRKKEKKKKVVLMVAKAEKEKGNKDDPTKGEKCGKDREEKGKEE